jgi:1,4-alpha-glucan branching enzyme
VRLDDALERAEPSCNAAWEDGVPRSWGEGGDLSTWSGPAVAEMAFAARAAELEVLAARSRAGVAAVRELLALQASDWPFMVSRGLAVPYARERFEQHRRGVRRALEGGAGADAAHLRNLAAGAEPSLLLAPG